MMLKTYFKGIGMLVGLIFGAGIFALPYAIFKAGFFWGIIHFVAAFFILVLLHFLYAEITFSVKEKHRFVGYVNKFLGGKIKIFAFFITILAYYGSLLVYGVLGGIFISNIFNGSAFVYSLLFFAVGALLVYLKLQKIALVNFYLTIPLLAFVFYMFLSSLSFVDSSNLNFDGSGLKDLAWFLPFGIWIFSMGGFAAVPEVRDIFERSSLKHFKSVVFISIVLSAVVYWLFVLAIVGVSGVETSPDALSGLPDIGRGVLMIGSLVGFLAVFTSFLVLGIDLKAIYFFDFKIPNIFAWFLVVVPPVTLFFFGFNDFTRILGIIGTLGLGGTGLLIIWMAKKVHNKFNFWQILAAIAIFLAVFYEIFNILF